MRSYENGVSTRRAILEAGKKLFYEKGFHDTSYDDISREAHVNRGSIYYHFKEKENLRYEVIWEYTMKKVAVAKQYCGDPHETYALGVYLLWYQFYHDPKLRRFLAEYNDDYPFYSPGSDLSRYFKTLYDHVFGPFWKHEFQSELPFAAIYGYMVGLIKLMEKRPEHSTPLDFFRQSFFGGGVLCGIPLEQLKRAWSILAADLANLPPEAFQAPLF